MRIHSDIIKWETVSDALTVQKGLGRIAGHVTFKTLRQGRSRARAQGIEVQLQAAYRDNGRRAGNSGSYGAMQPEYDGYAATYDEWGWLLAALFEIDPDMIVGTPKSPVYKSRDDFDHRTGLSYNPEKLLPLLEAGHWPSFVGHPDYTGGDPYPIVVGNAARTKRGYFVGRQGANRVDTQPSYWPGKLSPRTPDEVRAFAFPAEVTA